MAAAFFPATLLVAVIPRPAGAEAAPPGGGKAEAGAFPNASPAPPLHWVGAPLGRWDLSGSRVWSRAGDSNSPASYANSNLVFFDDTASHFVVNVADPVSPGGVVVSNSANDYVFGGAGAITGGDLTKLGSGRLTLAIRNTSAGVTRIEGGTLQLGAGGIAGTLGTGPVLDDTTLAFNRSDDITVPNEITGSGGLEQDGPGTVNLSGTLTYTGPTVVKTGGLDFATATLTFDAASGATLTIAAKAVARSTAGKLDLNVNSNTVAVDVTGAGILQLAATGYSSRNDSDLNFGPNHHENADFGCRLAASLDLGSKPRTIRGWSGCNDVARNGLTGCDCQFAGPIVGTAALTLVGQNSWQGINTMEVPFALLASNSWSGPLEVQRGSVYLGHSNALMVGNVLILDPPAGVNSRLFLYGFNAAVCDLQSGGAGDTLIADGNNVTSTNAGPVTLTVTENHPTTFAGSIMDWQTEFMAPDTGPLAPVLSLVKNGPATLTLTGTNNYSGATIINEGKLNINNTFNGTGPITVNPGATLGGNGLIHSAQVTVLNGGSLEAGGESAYGNLQLNALALGTAVGDSAVLNLAATAALEISGRDGLKTLGGPGSVTITVRGGIASLGSFPLISYNRDIGGAGFSAFRLGGLPPGVAGYLSNDTANAAIDLVVTRITVARWSGASSSNWCASGASSSKPWVLDSDGVTPVDYVAGESVRFDDSAANASVNIGPANVFPASVTVNNTARKLVIGGRFGIAGSGGLTKLGPGWLGLNTVNTYTGATVISAGTVTLGSAGAIPGGPGAGNVTVDGALDIAGHSQLLNNLSGRGSVDSLASVSSPIITVNETADTEFAGTLQNTTGSLGLAVAGGGTLTLNGHNTYSGPTEVGDGTLLVNGMLGETALTVRRGAALGGTGRIGGTATLLGGAALKLTADSPLTLGAVSLRGVVTVNVLGQVSMTNAASYVLLNYRRIDATNHFELAPVPGILNSGFTATLKATTNQLHLVIAAATTTGTIADVRHVVIFTQENRSFDHYFGSLHGVHGFSDHVTLMLTNGNSVLYQPSGTGYELPFPTSVSCITDLPHDWTSNHEEWDNGWHDQWITAKGTETMAFYQRSDLAYHYALADAFTICDEFHCSALTSTDPNRLYIFTGMIDPNDTGGGPVIANSVPSGGFGTNWLTYGQVLQNAGVTWKVYQANDNYDDDALAWFAAFKNAATTSPLYTNGMTPLGELTNGFAADVSNNVLPSVSWVVGPDYASEHPYYGSGAGSVLIQNLLHALAANPKVYNSTVFILDWDEGDGFFDHAIPINPPSGTADEFVSGTPIGLGERVPCIIVSPWTRGGYVCSQVFDHTSVLRFVEKWTGVTCPNLSAWRRQVCGDLTSAFDFAHPNTNFPAALATETDTACANGTTAVPPTQQTPPAQESGTLIARPLPYQPDARAILNGTSGNWSINMTNSGTASVHFTIYPNAYSSMLPLPFDVEPGGSARSTFNAVANGGNFDLSCYGPNGFLRRFRGNVNADFGHLEAVSFLNPITDGLEITLANPGSSPEVFQVTNGWYRNSLATYTVPAGSTNVVFLNASTNNGWYDLTVTAANDRLFLRRFAGHIETNAAPTVLVSSENPSSYRDQVTFTAAFPGFGTPSGTAQFLTNGVAMGLTLALTNGAAAVATALLPRTNNLVTVQYSGDLLNAPATNSLSQLVLNHPPVPATVVYQRAANLPFSILMSDLLTNVTDADGDPITLVGVGTDGLNLRTTNGVVLVTNPTYIVYTNSVMPGVNDGFNYTVSDGHGGISVGAIQMVVNTNYVAWTNGFLILSGSSAQVNFFGSPGVQYEVDRATNLVAGVGSGWVPISTNVAPFSGIIQVQDSFLDLGGPGAQPPATAFYRLKPNP